MGGRWAEDGAAGWLALNRVPGLRPERALALVAHLGSPAAVLAESSRALAALGVGAVARRGLRAPDRRGVAEDLLWVDGPGRTLLTHPDARYPGLLRQIADPPLVLFVHGQPEVLGRAAVAIVGSRRPSGGGRRHAGTVARDLAAAGIVVVSGLALGVDAAAHAGALDGGGATVAVAGCGPDRVYPRANAALAQRICSGDAGALVTEFPVGAPPRRRHFPRRNRIISGLCLATVVVEAGLRSGSLVTARLAGEQGRDVFAVPGSIANPLARGCHRLLREGAGLVESAADILAEVAPDRLRPDRVAGREPPVGCRSAAPSEGVARVLEAIGHDPVTFEELLSELALTPGELSSILTRLELQGFLDVTPGGELVRLPEG